MDPTQIRKVLDRGYYLYRIFESGSEGKQIGPLTAAIRSYNSFKELGFPVKIERLNAAGFRKWNQDFDALLEWIDQADIFILAGHIHQAFDFAAFNVPSIENLEVWILEILPALPPSLPCLDRTASEEARPDLLSALSEIASLSSLR